MNVAGGLYMTGPIMVFPTKMLLGAAFGALSGFAAGLMGTVTGPRKETEAAGGRGAEEVREGCTGTEGTLWLRARLTGGAATVEGAEAVNREGALTPGATA